MRRTTFISLVALAGLAATLLVPATADAQPGVTYRVTITNLTRAQPITPPLVTTHTVGTHVFVPGEPAGEPLATLAEEGNPMDLALVLQSSPGVESVAVGDGLILPGESASVEVTSRGRAVYLSAVGMLASTNDAFFGLESFFLPGQPWRRTVSVPAYDAGSEVNSEDCMYIPGPPCGNAGSRDPDGAEGFITVHNGIQGVGDLDPHVWDWRNPVAQIQIVRLP